MLLKQMERDILEPLMSKNTLVNEIKGKYRMKPTQHTPSCLISKLCKRAHQNEHDEQAHFLFPSSCRFVMLEGAFVSKVFFKAESLLSSLLYFSFSFFTFLHINVKETRSLTLFVMNFTICRLPFTINFYLF